MPSQEIPSSIFVGKLIVLKTCNSTQIIYGRYGTVSWYIVPKRSETSAQLTNRREARSGNLVQSDRQMDAGESGATPGQRLRKGNLE